MTASPEERPGAPAVGALVAFFRARLDEDEAVAKACQSPSPWRLSDHPSWSSVVDDAEGYGLIYNDVSPTLEEATHIARHDPARVLREVAAKRAIVALHRPYLAEYVDADGEDRSSVDCWSCETGGTPDSWPCETVRSLAAAYSGHPDYDEAWRP